VELLFVLLISAVLGFLATPSFGRLTEGAAVSKGQSALRMAIELARSEAIARASRAGVCRSPNANAPAPTCDDAAAGPIAARDWAAGWIVYAKGVGNAAPTFEAGDTLVRRQPSLATGSARGRVALWAPTAGALVFDWNGLRSAGPQGSFLIDWAPTGAVRPATALSPRARCLVLGATGRVDSVTPSSGACPA
jgi:Tfp pilus assembly protein FimT